MSVLILYRVGYIDFELHRKIFGVASINLWWENLNHVGFEEYKNDTNGISGTKKTQAKSIGIIVSVVIRSTP